jgi:kumamolisin
VLAVVVGLPVLAADPGGAATGTGVQFGVVGVTEVESWLGQDLSYAEAPPLEDTVDLYLGLVGDRQGLVQHALDTSDPRSPSYGSWTSPSEVGARFGATPDTVARVVGWFADRGATVAIDPTGTYVQGEVPISVAQEAFGVTYGVYETTSTPDRVVLTPEQAPTGLAPGLAGSVDRVYGAVEVVDVTAQEEASFGPAAAPQDVLAPGGGGDPWRTGTPEGCAEALAVTGDGHPVGLAPNQLREAYGLQPFFELGLRGQGTSVAVVDMNDYDPADLEAYRTCFGVADATPVTRHVRGEVVFVDGPGSEETTLDLSVISAFAPDVDRLDWFGTMTTNNDHELARAFFDMLVAPLDPSATGGRAPDLVSVSYGLCEPYLLGVDPGALVMVDLLDQVLATAAAGGTTYLVSSGDNGSTGCWRFFDDARQLEAAVEWPAASPWVLSVGGTNIDLADDNRIESTGVWNDRAFGASTGEVGGGGGGVSELQPRPPWQRGPGVTPGTTRLVPDVAAFADSAPGHLLRFNGSWTAVGGTSAATPLVAGSLAVLSGAAELGGQPRLGFAPPLLYAIGGLGGAGILDVTIGANDPNAIGVYAATPAFDLASGWGSPIYDRLADELSPPRAPDGGSGLVAEPGTGPRSLTWVAQPVLAAGEALEYRWDLDGDGVVDRTTTTDRVEAAYGADGAAHATVTVRTSLGREASFAGTAVVGSPTPTPDGLRPAFTG